jgi:CRISPR-associated protein Cas5d
MSTLHRNSIEFKVWGRYALFTDPISRVGGEKCSYQVPTYEALKGICKSIYWKPTLIWVVDEVRVMKRIRSQTKGTKPQEFGGGNSLAIYTFLADVEYQVRAHFEWNEARPELKDDRDEHKHHNIAKRMLVRGGRQDIFLGARDCQGYVEPCEFGSGVGPFDHTGELPFGWMFHGFDYPDEIGGDSLYARLASIAMIDGVIGFERPELCATRKLVRAMTVKSFATGQDARAVAEEFAELESKA